MRLKHSRFWKSLWDEYPMSPSIALCRVPELEYASRLDVSLRVLDHCCGDGTFASLAWPDARLAAGCDLQEFAIQQARKRGRHKRLDLCDASRRLPYADESFDLVFNNSALEHIPDLASTLREIARVLKPGGELAFSVLNRRFFEWWPMPEPTASEYKEWQPYIHVYSMAEWSELLENAGLKPLSVAGYFDRKAARALAYLDHAFSGKFLRGRKSAVVSCYQRLPRLCRSFWKWRLGNISWETAGDAGAGYFIRAVRQPGSTTTGV